ncbi:large-conductance mechanosensitive channel [Clostridia bacterium]|nr:large-conductance mechanosensitive channel [Clostridia bacterium]
MKIKKLLVDFKTFALQGNVLNLAVGVMVGGAFGKIVTSLVNDIFMPLIGLLTGGIDLGGLFLALDGKAYPTIQAAADAGVGTLNYGSFLSGVIDFLLIAACVFLFVRLVNRVVPQKPTEPPRKCPYCQSEIDPAATRCPHCTSALPELQTTTDPA